MKNLILRVGVVLTLLSGSLPSSGSQDPNPPGHVPNEGFDTSRSAQAEASQAVKGLSTQDLAAREAAARDLEEFRGGREVEVVIVPTVVVVVVLVVLLVLLL